MYGYSILEFLIALMVVAIPVVAILGGLLLAAFQVLKAGGRGDDQLNGSEAQVIQHIYQGLQRLEDRVESLETLLFEQGKKERQS